MLETHIFEQKNRPNSFLATYLPYFFRPSNSQSTNHMQETFLNKKIDQISFFTDIQTLFFQIIIEN